MIDDIINELREAGLDAWDKIPDPMKKIREMRESESPPGYVAEPPAEPGWYRVWCAEFYDGQYRVKEVWRSRSCGKNNGQLCVNGPWRVDELDGWYWGPKVEF